MKMKSWYDDEEDILGVKVGDGGYWKSIELPNGVVLDIDEKGQIVGVEVWKASKIFFGDAKKVLESAKTGSGK